MNENEIETIKSLGLTVRNQLRRSAKDDFCGLCYTASAILHNKLKDKGIETEICINYDHVFLCREDCIVDPTATQFGKSDEVVIASKNDIDTNEDNFWRIEYITDNPVKMVEQLKNIWDCYGWEETINEIEELSSKE